MVLQGLSYAFIHSRRKRGFIALDETFIYDLSKRVYLWAAREVKTKEVIAVKVSKGGGLGEFMRFLETVRDACSNR